MVIYEEMVTILHININENQMLDIVTLFSVFFMTNIRVRPLFPLSLAASEE